VTSAGALVSGLIIAGYLVIALFFLRFWRQSGDALFGYFSAAFSLLAVQRAMLALLEPDEGLWIFLYGMRAFAFLLIIYAIVVKNRAKTE
jgi:hypothetical protein